MASQAIGGGGYLPFLTSTSVTFIAGTTGSVGNHNLFTVTGDLTFYIFGVVGTTLTSGGSATLSMGTTNNVAWYMGAVPYTDFTATTTFEDSTSVGVEISSSGIPFWIAGGSPTIIYTVGTAALTGGKINFYALWKPLSVGATLT